MSSAGRNTQVGSRINHLETINAQDEYRIRNEYKSEMKLSPKSLAVSSMSGGPRFDATKSRLVLSHNPNALQLRSEARHQSRNGSQNFKTSHGGFSEDLEENFKETVDIQRRTLTKNQSLIYKKLTLEKTQRQRNKMVEEINKAPWRHKSNSKSMIVQYN